MRGQIFAGKIGAETGKTAGQNTAYDKHRRAAFASRPDYAMAGLNVEYQKRQVKLTRSKYLPSLSVGLKENWGTQMLNLDGSTLWNTIAFASLNIPVFHCA